MNYIEIVINEKTYEVKPNFDFVDRLEQRLDIMGFMGSVENGRPKLTDVAWVITSAVRSTGKEIEYSYIGEEVVKDWAGMLNTSAKLVAAILSGGPEKKPQDNKTQEQPATK